MDINWLAVGSIGQWFGALATFGAVVVALSQNKPKIKVTTKVCDVLQESFFTEESIKVAEDRLYITAVNIGNIPIQITSMGLKLPRKEKHHIHIVPEPNTIPKVLMPSDEVSIWTDAKVWSDKGIKDFYFAVSYDSANRVYYRKVSLYQRIKRFLWWRFGKIESNSINKGAEGNT